MNIPKERKVSSFDDSTINELFGTDDAEAEEIGRFREYFYHNDAYANINNSLPIRILVGHKGTGKSALLKRSYIEANDRKQLAIWLQPGDLALSTTTASDDSFVALIKRWKTDLLSVIAKRALERFTSLGLDAIADELKLEGIPKKISGFVPLVIKKIVGKKRKDLPEADKAIVASLASIKYMTIFIDDLDRGWTAKAGEIMNVSAMLNAVRDITREDSRIQFRIGLRTDVYYLCRTSEESTDKIEQHVVWLRWTPDEVLRVIGMRVASFFGAPNPHDIVRSLSQSQICDNLLSKAMHPRFLGNGAWSNRPIHKIILSVTRRRPRDAVKLLRGAAREAFKDKQVLIRSQDFEKCLSFYSNERLQDLENEFRTEMPKLKDLLQNFRPAARTRKTKDSFFYRHDALITKLRNRRQNVTLTFTNGRLVTEKSLIQFLYRIDFIAARKDVDSRIERRHFEENQFLADDFSESGWDWEVHPAYRWALHSIEMQRLLDSIDENLYSE